MKVVDPVSVLLDLKGRQVFSVGPDATVFSAIELMAEKSIGALLVMHEGQLLGIISERDYARKVILQGRSSKETRVREIMTDSPITITGETTVDEAMRTITNHRIRHLPVLNQAKTVAGILSIGDVVNWIVNSQHETIQHLEHYIAGDLTH
jgi:CBS domain-containing protein